MTTRKIIAAAALGAIMAVAASAQDYKSFRDEFNEIQTQARMRFGPFRFRPVIQLRDIGHDDNVYYRESDNSPVGDFMGTISPEVKAYLTMGHTLILSFTENPEYTHYLNENRLRAFTNSFSPKVRLNLFNRFSISGDYHYNKHQRRVLNEFAGNVSDTTKGYSAGVFYETPRGSSIGFSGTVERFEYEDVVSSDFSLDLSRNLNRQEKTGNFEFYYKAFAESHIFLKVGSTTYAFDHVDSRWRDSRSTQIMGGIRFPLLGRARGTLALGYKKFTPQDASQKPFSGLIADSSLIFKFGRMNLRLGFSRKNQFSYSDSALYYVDTKADTGVSFYLTRLFRLDYLFQYGQLSYPEPYPVQSESGAMIDLLRKDMYRGHSVGLTLRVFRTTGLSLSYNFFDRTSNAPGYTFRRNFLGFGLTQDF
jgi:hypothetical protein